MPGQVGPAVISGHVDSMSGPAAFYRLGDLRRGDPIRVLRADGDWLAFEVTASARYAKASFPTDAVFGPVTGPVLRLITCGGAFDRSSGHYLDNVVVTARPTDQSAIRRATAGLILAAWRAGQAVAAREAAAVARTSREMDIQGMGNDTPEACRSSSLRNSR
jgi:Sortase domain